MSSVTSLLTLLLPSTFIATIKLPFHYVLRQPSYLLLAIIATGPVPRHIAFEMDGNRGMREDWARRARRAITTDSTHW